MNDNNHPELPAVTTDQLPEQFNSAPRGLTVDCSKNLNICVPPSCSSSEIAALFNKIEPMPQSERGFNDKLGIAATAALQNNGFDTPVYINSSTNVNVMFEDIMKSTIIDIPGDEDD